MASIQISGIVREARRFQQLLGRPMTAAERDRLAGELDRILAEIDAILSAHGHTVACLPAPSRRAWAFLKGLDIRKLPVVERPPAPAGGSSSGAAAAPRRLRELRFPRLDGYLSRLLEALACAVAERRYDPAAALSTIRNTRDRLEQDMRRAGPEGVLPPDQAELLAWFRVFSGESALAEYIEAVRRATAVLSGLTSGRVRWRLPLFIQFRPLRPICRWKMLADGSLVVLQTPMVAFDRAAFGLVGGMLAGDRGARRRLHTLMLGPDFRAFQDRLRAAVPEAEPPGGMAHDLSAVFERVNRECFDGRCPRPRLRWSGTLAVRQWEQYHPVHDTVIISSALDQAHVPEYVVDYVMYHELLHKELGGEFDGDRHRVHTPAFREAERRFPRQAEAEAWLARMTGR